MSLTSYLVRYLFSIIKKRTRNRINALAKKSSSQVTFHLSIIYLALTTALLAGFGYAAVLAVLLSYGLPNGSWWVPMIQAHGHAQLMGWTGLFIIGVSLYFVPRLTGKPLRFPSWGKWIGLLIGGGILLRSIIQPLLEVVATGLARAFLRWGMGLAGVAELVGVGLYLVLLVATMRGSLQGRPRPAFGEVKLFLMTMFAGWLLYSLLTTWLTVAAACQGNSLLDMAWNRYAADLYLGLVLLPVTMAFSVRTFPLYLRLPPPRWPVQKVGLLYLLGFAVEQGTVLLRLTDVLVDISWGIRLETVGQGIKGLALLWFVWELDVLLRRKSPWTVERIGTPSEAVRKRPRPRLPDYGEFGRFEWLLYSAYGWLVLAALFEVGMAVGVLVG